MGRADPVGDRVLNLQGSYERGAVGGFRVPGYYISQNGRALVVRSPAGACTTLHMKGYDYGTVGTVGTVGSFEVRHADKSDPLPLSIHFGNGTVLTRVTDCFV